MKNTKVRADCHGVFGLALALWMIIGVMTARAKSDRSASSAPANFATGTKPYTMYMGTDFSVEWQGKLRPVTDVQGSAFVVNVGGKSVEVPVRFTNLKIKMDDALKVSATRAEISHLAAERAYTPGADPKRIYDQTVQMGMDAQTLSDMSAVRLNMAESRLGLARANGAAAQDVGQMSTTVEQDRAQMNQTFDAQNATINTLADAGSRVAAAEARHLYDALSLTFDISAAKQLAKPYIVVIARYLEKSDDPQSGRIWVYAQEFDHVDEKPAKFSMLRGGFSPGYKLEDVQLHVYDGGTEIATNVARKRVDLTVDEAFQLSTVQYVQDHRGATLPPEAVKALAPHNLRSRFGPDVLNRTYYVKVAKNGMPSGVFVDESCREMAPPDVQTALLALRFNPALKHGQPVEGVASVQPARFDL